MVGQLNLSSQRGASIATAIADNVSVNQVGDLTASSGDGIAATSSAIVTGGVGQTASQTNTNTATATFEGSQSNIVVAVSEDDDEATPPTSPSAEGSITQSDGLDVALQGQLVGQLNVSGQHGLAVATAVSRDVTVTSGNGSASGNGIEAVSSAEAVAPVVQTVLGEEIVEEGVEQTGEERVYAPGQSNVNTAATTFNGSQANIDAGAPGDVTAGIAQIDGLDLSLQGQLVGQLNISGQGGLAIATALSDPVTVNQSGYLDAGASGIIATSSAVAKAPVIQTVSQANDNSATATFNGNQATITADADGDVILSEPVSVIGLAQVEEAGPGIEQIDAVDVALQGQLVGQVNFNVQRGASIATAISDDVTVIQSGELTALNGDGIVATSSAVATAPVVQTATQSNTNSAEATFGGNQAGVDADAGGNVIAASEPRETDPNLVEVERGFDPGITQVDGLDIALQGSARRANQSQRTAWVGGCNGDLTQRHGDERIRPG